MIKETGGSAFPWVQPATGDNGAVICYGMTMRDYFAAKAMSYWLSLPIDKEQLEISAAQAYNVADAMMEARK